MTDILAGSEPTRDGPLAPAADSPYWQFYERVAAAQVAEWLPHEPCRVLDLTAGQHGCPEQLRAAGHEVVTALSPDDHQPRPAAASAPGRGAELPAIDIEGRTLPVRADRRRLLWVQSGSVDAVLAHSRELSPAAEVTVQDLFEVLRPGGRLMLVADSLTAGLSRLADKGRWAELADVPHADVLLVPQDDGSVVRCFWPEELAEMLAAAGFDVEWVRPRSVLSPPVVERAVAESGEQALTLLVRTELALAQEREGESTGLHLVVSARRPG